MNCLHQIAPLALALATSCWTGAATSGVTIQSPAAAQTPSIAILPDGARLRIPFTGLLQAADSPGGPWTDLPTAASPFLTDRHGPHKFYRTRATAAVQSVFSSRAVVDWTITGPLQRHFDLALAGQPDGIFPPVREKPYFNGTLQMAEYDLPVRLRVRGNSSLQECPFPKLKLKIDSETRAGTPLFDAREIKIGTHCAEGGEGNVGRLRDERAAYREALAYETMELLAFVGPRVRRARILYRDTTPPAPPASVGWQLTRHALILDDIEVVGERLGGRALDDEETASLKDAGFDAQLITDLQFLHALLGNWDYALSADGQGLWNTDVIELAGGKLIPVAGDFDLASWVTGTVRLSAPHYYRPELPDLERQARYEIEQIRERVSSASFAAAVDRFVRRRAALEAHIHTAEVDEDGRGNALQHVLAFYEAISATATQ